MTNLVWHIQTDGIRVYEEVTAPQQVIVLKGGGIIFSGPTEIGFSDFDPT